MKTKASVKTNSMTRSPVPLALVVIALALACFGLLPKTQAVIPATPTSASTPTPTSVLGPTGGWNVVPSPNTGSPNNTLFGVAAIASNDVWAVGAYGVLGISAQLLIEHWDGSSWRRAASPALTTPNELLAVNAIAANDVWAVGGYDSGGRALIEHWDGTSWN